MNPFDNLTPFGYDASFAYDLEGSAVVVLCVAGRFRMPPGGTVGREPLEIMEEQLPPAMADEYWSNPAKSSLKSAGQGVPNRPGAEVYVRGSAWATAGRPTVRMRTSVRVDSCSKQVDVVGNRFWVRGLVDMAPTSPEPFVSMPLLYERSFGGTAWSKDGRVLAQEPRNHVGRGVYASQQDAADQLLPNLEAPGAYTESWNGRNTPCGYGPIPGSWQPRLGWAGTYDQKWLDERIPLWPRDTDPRFFCAAAPGLSFNGPLRGGEAVLIEGMSPDGDFIFCLPEYRLLGKSIYADRTIRGALHLDGVLLEPDHRAVTLFWRRVVPLGHGPRVHLRSIVRIAEPWEDLPA